MIKSLPATHGRLRHQIDSKSYPRAVLVDDPGQCFRICYKTGHTSFSQNAVVRFTFKSDLTMQPAFTIDKRLSDIPIESGGAEKMDEWNARSLQVTDITGDHKGEQNLKSISV